MELEAEPLDNLGDFPLIIPVLFAAAAGLRQSFLALRFRAFLGLAPRRQIGGVASRVDSQVDDRDTQALDQYIEDILQVRTMRFLAKHLLESRDIPLVGHGAFGLDADEAAESLIAAQFGK